jgi:hypothetical protein
MKYILGTLSNKKEYMIADSDTRTVSTVTFKAAAADSYRNAILKNNGSILWSINSLIITCDFKKSVYICKQADKILTYNFYSNQFELIPTKEFQHFDRVALKTGYFAMGNQRQIYLAKNAYYFMKYTKMQSRNNYKLFLVPSQEIPNLFGGNDFSHEGCIKDKLQYEIYLHINNLAPKSIRCVEVLSKGSDLLFILDISDKYIRKLRNKYENEVTEYSIARYIDEEYLHWGSNPKISNFVEEYIPLIKHKNPQKKVI